MDKENRLPQFLILDGIYHELNEEVKDFGLCLACKYYDQKRFCKPINECHRYTIINTEEKPIVYCDIVNNYTAIQDNKRLLLAKIYNPIKLEFKKVESNA